LAQAKACSEAAGRCRRGEARAQRQLADGRVQGRVVDRLRRGAEAEHHVAAARRGEVVAAEVGAGRIDFQLLELEHVHRFHRQVVVKLKLPHSMSIGRKASFSSEPATRSLDTSTGLMTLMPFWMKVLSPQLTTWRPRRMLPLCPPMVKSL
jgi:hypothetical protein